MQYQVLRGDVLFAAIKPKGTQTKAIMGANTVSMSFELPSFLDFKIGDSVEVYGETYYLNTDPIVKEESSIRWAYTLEFQAIPYDLIRAKYFFYDQDNLLKESEFSITGTAQVFLDLLLQNVSRIQSGWSIGDVDETIVKTLSFSNENCMTVLSRLAEEFKTEYWVVGQVINLTKDGEVLPISLAYGMGNGLRKIERIPLDNNPPISRLYVFGSDKNLPADYRNYSTKLRLPLVAAPYGYIEVTPIDGKIREEIYTNPEIFPRRIGTVTSTSANNVITDSALDFNINSQLIPGVTAKIKFTSGQLSGYEFDFREGGYNHTTKTITFNVNKDEKDLEVPSALLFPQVGDEWILLGVDMPSIYIQAAEEELLADGTIYLANNCGSRFNYNITTDPFHFERQGLYLSLGKLVHVVSDKFGLDEDIRVVGYTRDIQKPFEYPSVEVSNVLQINPVLLADSRQRTIDNAIKIGRLTDVARQRNMWRTTSELTTMLDTLRAEMLLIMVAGSNYETTVVSEVNATEFKTSTGEVQHQQFIENGGHWDVSAFTGDIPTDDAYYVYIRANRTSEAASIILSATKMDVETGSTYYYFPFGIISTLIGDQRIFTSTKGYTRITGNNIYTGKIISNSGLSYLDLDNDEFSLGDDESGMDFNVTEPDTLTIKGAVATKQIKVGSDGHINAFINGVTDVIDPEKSVRFGAGGELGDPDLPFQVLDDGTVLMKKAIISGEIELGFDPDTTPEGETSGWQFSSSAILNDAGPTGTPEGNNFALVRGTSKHDNGDFTEFSFGTNLIPATSGGAFTQLGRIKNKRPVVGTIPGFDDTTNIALEVEASGANHNIALAIKGGITMNTATAKTWTGDIQLTIGSKTFEFVNGLLMDVHT